MSTPESVAADPLAQLEELETQEAAVARGEAPSAEPAGSPSPPQLLAGKYESPEQLEKAYLESQRAMHEATQEAARAREQAEQAMRQAQQPQQPAYQQAAPQQQTGDPISAYAAQLAGLQVSEFNDLWFTEPQRASSLMARATADYTAALVGQAQQQALQPLQEMARQQATESVVTKLRQQYGDEVVQQHGQALMEIIQQDPDYYLTDSNINYQRLSLALDASLYRGGQVIQPRDEAGRYQPVSDAARTVHTEGGSTGHTPAGGQPVQPGDELDPEIRILKQDHAGTQDTFGGTPLDMPLRR